MQLKGLYKLKHSGIWYFQPPMVGGVRPKPINLKTKDEETAVQAYHEAVIDAGRLFAGGSIRMEAARYLAEKARAGQHSPRTTEESSKVFESFADHCGNRALASVTHEDVAGYQLALIDAGRAESTMRAALGRINGLLTWAVEEGILRKHPGKRIKRPQAHPTKTERYCTKAERDRLIAAAAQTRKVGGQTVFLPYLEAYLWLGFFAGLRKSEIVEVHRDWIDLDGGVIHVRETATFRPKSRQSRTIRMGGKLAAFLRGYMERVPPGEHPYLLCPEIGPGRKQKTRGRKAWRYRFDPKKSFKALVREEGLEWVTTHTMRHTFATLHIQAGTPLGMVAKELGDDEALVFRVYVGYSRHSGHESAID